MSFRKRRGSSCRPHSLGRKAGFSDAGAEICAWSKAEKDMVLQAHVQGYGQPATAVKATSKIGRVNCPVYGQALEISKRATYGQADGKAQGAGRGKAWL